MIAQYLHLGEYLHAPVVLNRVLDFMEKAERPLTNNEVARGLGLSWPRSSIALTRLTDKGLLVRWKGDVTFNESAGGARPPITIFRRVWLYAPAAGFGVDNGGGE